MPVESDEDRLVFVNPDEFGAVFTYAVNGGAGVSLAGVFDNPPERHFGGDVGVAMSGPPILISRARDLPAGAVDGEATPDRISLAGRTYAPRLFEPDGSGMVRITLEAV